MKDIRGQQLFIHSLVRIDIRPKKRGQSLANQRGIVGQPLTLHIRDIHRDARQRKQRDHDRFSASYASRNTNFNHIPLSFDMFQNKLYLIRCQGYTMHPIRLLGQCHGKSSGNALLQFLVRDMNLEHLFRKVLETRKRNATRNLYGSRKHPYPEMWRKIIARNRNLQRFLRLLLDRDRNRHCLRIQINPINLTQLNDPRNAPIGITNLGKNRPHLI